MYVCMYHSWYTTPRNPEEADPPRIVAVPDTTGLHHIHTYIHTSSTLMDPHPFKYAYIHKYIHSNTISSALYIPF